jgi:hypothetical protein
VDRLKRSDGKVIINGENAHRLPDSLVKKQIVRHIEVFDQQAQGAMLRSEKIKQFC